MIRNKRFLMTLAIAAALCMGAPGWLAAADTADAVATVNGKPIPRAVYDRELSGYLRRMAQSGRSVSEMNMGEVRRGVVDNLVASELLWLECQRLKLVADKAEVDAQMAEFRKNYTDLAKLNEALAKVGLTDEELRDLIERQASIRKFIDAKITGTINITQKDIQAFYDEHKNWFFRPELVKASHILVKVPEDATEEMRKDARKRAEDIRKKALAGEDFAALARQYSEGPSKENGGELPPFSRERMVKPFSDAAFALKPGDISDVVETTYGYHVIRVAEHMAEGPVPLEEVSEGITKRLRQEEVNRRLADYVKKMRESAKITMNVPDA